MTRDSNGQRDAEARVTSAALFPRPIWASERAYLLASVAGVVGLGNIWRFPYVAGEGGGGSFVLAYLCCVIVIAIPLAAVESTAGSLVRRSPVGLFRRIHPRWGPWFGWLPIGVTIAIMSYYFVITGWTLGYAVDATRSDVKVFDVFTSGLASLWYFLAVSLLVFVVIVRGVGAIERISRLLLPLLVLIVGGLAIYAQTLDGAGEAAAFYLGFDRESFLSASTWQTAAGQSFYSLGVGQGILIAYGSYVPAGVNIPRSTAVIAITNSTISVVAGLMVFPIVFTFGIAPDAGSELSFNAFPRVLDTITGGHLLGIAFFWLLFVAGFTSCISGAVVVMSAVRDEFRLPRVQTALLVVAGIALVGVPSAISFTSIGLSIGGEPFLDRMDQITGSGAMVATGLLGAALIGWRLPMRRLVNAMNADMRSFGPIRVSPGLILWLGRLAPIAVLVWFGVTLVL